MEADQLQVRRENERMRPLEASLREQERNSMKNEDLYAQNIRFEEKSEAEKAKLESALSTLALLRSPALSSPSVGFGSPEMAFSSPNLYAL